MSANGIGVRRCDVLTKSEGRQTVHESAPEEAARHREMVPPSTDQTTRTRSVKPLTTAKARGWKRLSLLLTVSLPD